MDPFAPSAIQAALTKLATAESAARAIYVWIDQHVTASDVIPRRMNPELSGLFDSLGRALNDAKGIASEMDELATAAASKAIQGVPLTEQERKYLEYLGVLRSGRNDRDSTSQAAN